MWIVKEGYKNHSTYTQNKNIKLPKLPTEIGKTDEDRASFCY